MDGMDMDAVLNTFIAESRELLQEMESALLQVEQTPDDPDLINAIFRAAHTIKGSGGLFGLEDIVGFTHVMESVLDRVRNGEVKIDAKLAALLLHSGDHLSALIEALAARSPLPDAEMKQGQKLTESFVVYLDEKKKAAMKKHLPTEHETPYETFGGQAVESDQWHLSLRFGPDVMKNGMDPLVIIRYLGTMGKVVHIVTLLDAIPPAAEMDPESCYLGFEIGFRSDVDKSAIEQAFEFVREDAHIRILPPNSMIHEYVKLIRDMQQSGLRIGEILVACGSLTPHELEEALKIQAEGAESRPNARPIGEVLVEEHMVQPEVVEAALVRQKKAGEPAKQQKTIRVDADKLDELINLIGELVIAGAGVNQIAAQMKSGLMTEAAATMSRLVEEVRDSSLSLRMVQVGETFNRFHRIVRDVSLELGKDIALVIHGADTELDKSVVEKIGDPLMHLVRNSMDHGIEPAEVRRQRGKPAQGTVEFNAYHDSGSVVIEVIDDGGGLNRDRIRAKAIERGLVQPEQALSDQDVYNLIFEAGFSTAEKITNLSGRGVGMDVVRQNIHALRGTVTVDSEAGVGTRFTIRLPLTLAIIDGFLVEVSGAAFVIPLASVVECVELQAAGVDRHYLNLRGEVLPFVCLRELFDIPGATPPRENVVVVRTALLKVGIVVDALRGEFQTVIKPLGTLFRHLRGIAGSTILGSGAVALILDVEALASIAARQETDRLTGPSSRPLIATHATGGKP